MRELLLVGAAVLAGIATFVVLRRRLGSDCLP